LGVTKRPQKKGGKGESNSKIGLYCPRGKRLGNSLVRLVNGRKEKKKEGD